MITKKHNQYTFTAENKTVIVYEFGKEIARREFKKEIENEKMLNIAINVMANIEYDFVYKPILLYNVNSFNELFQLTTNKTTCKYNKHSISSHISCESPGHYNFYNIVPSDAVCKAIAENMLNIDYDSIYFKIIVHGDKASIYAEYNAIIGGYLLAKINTNTMPEILYKQEE